VKYGSEQGLSSLLRDYVVVKKTVGLRTEILVTLTFLLVAALLLGGMLMLRLTEQRLLAERLRHLDETARFFALALSEQQRSADSSHSSRLRQRLLDKLSENANCDGWWLFDQDLNALDSFTSGGQQPFSLPRRQQVKLTGNMEVRVHFPALLNLFDSASAGVQLALPFYADQRFAGVLEMHFSLEDIRLQLLDALKILLLYVSLYGLVLIAAGYFLLQRNIIKPAKLLLRATRDVGRGDLNTRLPIAGPTELAQLATAYNDMVMALNKSQAQTRIHIEELKKTNRQLQQARDELIRSEKMASVGQLAAGLAHELGNPLAALIGYLELLKTRLSAADKDLAQRCLAETQRIDYLVRELLNFSRPADKNSIDEVDCIAELRACRDLLARQGTFKEVHVADQLADVSAMVEINRQKLHQVYINLLINAVHACEKKGVIELTAGCGQDDVWLQIKDDGCGITAGNLPRIFDPFYTTKAPGEGTGLGLTICHRIIDEAGGRLQVKSCPGQGSVFRLVLPLAADR
jgi:signal transduction histidine kinase